MISVYVVDASELLRRGLRGALAETPDLVVAGEAATTADALPDVDRLAPDVIVIDLDDNEDAAHRFCEILTSGPRPRPILVALRTSDRSRIGDAMLAGASGHLVLTDPVDEIIDRIRDAHGTLPTLGTDLVGDLFARVRSGHASHRDPLADLTAREREIMTLLADGLDNRRIGDALHLSPKTVKNYVSAILGKLGMASRTEAAVLAAREAARVDGGA
jgi:DNA-binding NarL/FixJ family response regulator